MQLVKIGLINCNPIVGAFHQKLEKIIEYAKQTARERCMLASFNEQAISGYPCQDLIQWPTFVTDQHAVLEQFATFTETLPFPTIFVVGVTVAKAGDLYNCAAVVQNGHILGIVPKEKLPEYNVFYDNRTFSPGVPYFVEDLAMPSGAIVPLGDLIFDTSFGTLAVEICEDIWDKEGPMARRSHSGAEIVVNISASPGRVGVLNTRREMLATRSSDNGVIVVYCNRVGGQDQLVFDGGGFVYNNGRLLYEAPLFREGLSTVVVDMDIARQLRRGNTTLRTSTREYKQQGKEVQRIHAVKNFPQTVTYAYPRSLLENPFLANTEPPHSERETQLAYLTNLITMGLGDYLKRPAILIDS